MAEQEPPIIRQLSFEGEMAPLKKWGQTNGYSANPLILTTHSLVSRGYEATLKWPKPPRTPLDIVEIHASEQARGILDFIANSPKGQALIEAGAMRMGGVTIDDDDSFSLLLRNSGYSLETQLQIFAFNQRNKAYGTAKEIANAFNKPQLGEIFERKTLPESPFMTLAILAQREYDTGEAALKSTLPFLSDVPEITFERLKELTEELIDEAVALPHRKKRKK